ncbi:conserved hypothetical protein [Aeromonas salmonicida]|nr:conserved hypothetical protein [Aeromonas salmonicida]
MGLLALLFNEGIGIALQLADAAVALALPAISRVLPVPGFEQFTLLRGEAQPVLLAHIEVGAGDLASYQPFGWLHPALLEVHQHLALAVLIRGAIPVGEAVVGPVAIYLADGGEEVVHVPLHLVELIALAAIFASTLLPALQLMAKFPGGYHVFPLDTGGSFGLLARFITAAGQIRAHFFALIANVAAAVEGGDCGLGLIELDQILLGGAKSLGMKGQADQQSQGDREQGTKHEDPWQ